MISTISFKYFVFTKNQEKIIEKLNNDKRLRTSENIQLVQNKKLVKLQFNGYDYMSYKQKKYILTQTQFQTTEYFNYFINDSKISIIDIFNIKSFQTEEYVLQAIERNDIKNILNIGFFQSIKWYRLLKNRNKITDILFDNEFLHQSDLIIPELQYLNFNQLKKLTRLECFCSSEVLNYILNMDIVNEQVQLLGTDLFLKPEFMEKMIIDTLKPLYISSDTFKEYITIRKQEILKELKGYEEYQLKRNKYYIIDMLYKYNTIKYFEGITHETV